MAEAPEKLPYRIVLRPIANPLPIGLLALLVSTTSVSALQLGWIPSGQAPVVGRIVVALALFLQLPGAALGFLARDPAAGTGMAVLGGTWLAIGVTLVSTPPGTSSAGLGLALVAVAAALVVPIAASMAKPVSVLVLSTSALRFALTGAYELSAVAAWETAAGVLGVVLGVVALYAAMAFELEDVHQRAVLPTGRRGPAKRAMLADLGEQVAGVQHEAGVRRQL